MSTQPVDLIQFGREALERQKRGMALLERCEREELERYEIMGRAVECYVMARRQLAILQFKVRGGESDRELTCEIAVAFEKKHDAARVLCEMGLEPKD